MEKQNNIFTVTDVVNHYHEQKINGEIKVYFKKSDVRVHNSKLDKPYYIIKPLVVKIGEEFDDHARYSIFLKPKYYYRMNLIGADVWLLIIDDDSKTFQNEEGKDISFYDVTLKYITNVKLIELISKKALAQHNIEEFDDDEL